MSPKPEDDQHNQSSSTDPPKLPPPPSPSQDPRLAITGDSPPNVPETDDIFKLAPRSAMQLFARSVELLVNITGDIPPTPPPTSPTMPNMRGMMAERELIRSNSEKNLARMMQEAAAAQPAASSSGRPPASSQSSSSNISTLQPIDGVQLRQRPKAPAPPPSKAPEPYIVVGENSQPINVQHGAVSRKFYARLIPPFSLTEYLERLHKYCPTSTAVYLATSLYIHRMAVEEKSIAVSRRNAHRLVLGGLRVAMKALEDHSYAHSKIAKVGGVTEKELTRLEINFCFLTNFDLAVNEKDLAKQWGILKKQQPLKPLDHVLPTHPPKGKSKEQAPAGKENERPEGQ